MIKKREKKQQKKHVSCLRPSKMIFLHVQKNSLFLKKKELVFKCFAGYDGFYGGREKENYWRPQEDEKPSERGTTGIVYNC